MDKYFFALIISIATFLNCSYVSAEPFAKNTETMLANYSKQINYQLPKMIDSETRFDNTTANGKKLIYSYTMVNFDPGVVNNKLFDKDFVKLVLSKLCKDENKISMLKSGVSYEYMYKDNSGKVFYKKEITRKDCNL